MHKIIPVPASKSESNRALLIAALCKQPCRLENLATARDTRTMQRLLAAESETWDVGDAGTTMRFLTAFAAATGRRSVMTGTARMQQRPIGILVDALRQLGAEIRYLGEQGYPPLQVMGNTLRGGEVTVRGDVSSQFVSALLMIGPVLKGGLRLKLTGKIGSRPYIHMTLELMAYFGVKAEWEGNEIRVPEAPYVARDYRIETDWSGASYWYSMAALAEEAEFFIPGLRKDSWQGDARIAEMMLPLGVETEFTEGGIHLKKTKMQLPPEGLFYDFSDVPDMAQTLAVAAGALGIPLRMTGLESLRIKETDRIAALQAELAKFGISMQEESKGEFVISGKFHPSSQPVATYEDHRMAMAFAPLMLLQEGLEIEDPGVVAKSYPEFWEHMKLVMGD